MSWMWFGVRALFCSLTLRQIRADQNTLIALITDGITYYWFDLVKMVFKQTFITSGYFAHKD